MKLPANMTYQVKSSFQGRYLLPPVDADFSAPNLLIALGCAAPLSRQRTHQR
jgi:hypothetical protein